MSEAIDVTTTEKNDSAVEEQAKNENEETPTVEELMAQLAEAKATGAKQKQALDKALREKGEITKALRAKQTAEERATEEKEEAERLQREKYEQVEKELNHMKAVSAYKSLSTEKAVENLIDAISDGDHNAVAALIENEVKSAVAKAEAEWKKSRPRVNVGGSYTGMTKDQIMQIEDRAERRKAIAMNQELFCQEVEYGSRREFD